MAKCLQVLKVCKTADERQDYSFNLTDEFANRWAANRQFNAGATVRPKDLPATGFEYDAGAGGVSSGEAEPAWPATGTVQDGSIEWTAQAISYDGLRHRIEEVEWIPDAPLQVSDQVEVDEPGLQEVRVHVDPGGEVGETYDIIGRITTDTGLIFDVKIELTIA